MDARDQDSLLVTDPTGPRASSEGLDEVELCRFVGHDRWGDKPSWTSWDRDHGRGFGQGYYYKTVHEAVRVQVDPWDRVVTIRLNVPKWIHRTEINWPYPRVASAEDLNLLQLQALVEGALSVDLDSVSRWAARLFSVGVDLAVDDEANAIEGVANLRRRHNTKGPRKIGNERLIQDPYSVYWSGRRARWYGKGHELDACGVPGVSGVLRFEATYSGTRPIRDLFGRVLPAHMLPTLACICRPDVRAWALGREARLYRFVPSAVRASAPIDLQTTDGGAELRSVRAAIRAYADEMRMGKRLGERKTLTSEHERRLVYAWTFAPSLSSPELADQLGVSENVVRGLLDDLARIGIPPGRRSARSVSEQVLPQLEPFLSAAKSAPRLRDVDVAFSPWVLARARNR